MPRGRRKNFNNRSLNRGRSRRNNFNTFNRFRYNFKRRGKLDHLVDITRLRFGLNPTQYREDIRYTRRTNLFASVFFGEFKKEKVGNRQYKIFDEWIDESDLHAFKGKDKGLF